MPRIGQPDGCARVADQGGDIAFLGLAGERRGPPLQGQGGSSVSIAGEYAFSVLCQGQAAAIGPLHAVPDVRGHVGGMLQAQVSPGLFVPCKVTVLSGREAASQRKGAARFFFHRQRHARARQQHIAFPGTDQLGLVNHEIHPALPPGFGIR